MVGIFLAFVSVLLMFRTGLVYVGYLPVEGIWGSKPVWLHLVCTVLVKWGFAFGIFGLLLGGVVQFLVWRRVISAEGDLSLFMGKLSLLFLIFFLVLLL